MADIAIPMSRKRSEDKEPLAKRMPFWTERREVKNFLPSDVILTTARRKNLLPSVTASQCNVILKGFALKNLLPSEHFV